MLPARPRRARRDNDRRRRRHRRLAVHSDQRCGKLPLHHAPGGHRTAYVIAELDSAPQAYYRLEKEVVEYGQNVIWGHLGNRAYPVTVPHLGLDADWFPRDARLATSDGVRLITIVVASSPGGGELIAEKLARVYLRAAS